MSHDWLRLWHDMPTDPKFRVIAKKSGRPLPEVLAVFVLMLTEASKNETERGSLANWQDDDAAAGLDMDPEHVSAIRTAMQGKTLTGNKLAGWENRQPKREDSSTERVRAFRAKRNDEKRNETPCNATKRTETLDKIRLDEIREEKISAGQSDQEPARASEPLAGWPELKAVFNGSTELMLQDVQRWMGPIANRQDAVNWLSGTVAASGAQRTAEAWTIVTAKLARNELVPNPLPLWAKTAKGLRTAAPSDSPQRAPPSWSREARNAKTAELRAMVRSGEIG